MYWLNGNRQRVDRCNDKLTETDKAPGCSLDRNTKAGTRTSTKKNVLKGHEMKKMKYYTDNMRCTGW